ncbi:uncharacterized protein TEOVI_000861700 [Trypanosoma equiperdum]|uniref:Uncharacterized protein n=1 Tax=Trypanosoma equiperdum TaxID=5694 RepID=A0A1G4I0L5_TRYEQ|nr:hypothetical protein, conserved [Trypanosoma equiperdum]
MERRIEEDEKHLQGWCRDGVYGCQIPSPELRLHSSSNRGHGTEQLGREEQCEWRRPGMKKGISVTHTTERFDTKPIVVSRASRGNVDSPALSSSGSLCASNDLLSVEQELKELLEGYRHIVGNGCEDWKIGGNSSHETPACVPGRVLTRRGELSNACGEYESKNTSGSETGGGKKNATRDEDTSLPVSSVRGDHSTDANTPTPLVQLSTDILMTSNPAAGGGMWGCELSREAYSSTPVAQGSSHVDIFANALTEDQLSRSFDVQSQERKQAMGFLRQQLGTTIPSQNVRTTSPARQLSWNSTLLVDAIENSNEADNSFGMGFDTVWYPPRKDEVHSPVPPITRREFAIANSSGSASCNVKTNRSGHGVHILPPSQRQEGSKNFFGRGMVVNRCDVPLLSPHQPSCSSLLRHEVTHSEEGRPSQGDVDYNASTRVKGGDRNPLRKRRGQHVKHEPSSCEHRRGGDSTTPEIATSARRTENHSMRSGAMPMDAERACDGLDTSAEWRRCTRLGTWEVGVGVDGRVEEKIPKISGEVALGKFSDISQRQQQFQLHQHQHQQQRALFHSGRRRCSQSDRGVVNRFHENVERYMAAVESNNRYSTVLPHFADSLVGAAISDLFPAVKRRQAQLKQSQYAEAEAARTMRGCYRN